MTHIESHQKQRTYTHRACACDIEYEARPSFVLIEHGYYTDDRARPDVPYSLIGKKTGSVWECTLVFEPLDQEDVQSVGVDLPDSHWQNVDLIPGLSTVIQNYFDPTYKPNESLIRQVDILLRKSKETGTPFAELLQQSCLTQ